MRFLTIRSLTPVEVKDVEGNLLYKAKTGKIFTLPVFCKLYIKGKYEILSKRTPYTLKLPYYKPEKNVSFKGFKKIFFTNNPNKATINVIDGALIIDKDFFNSLNVIQKLFVLSHELGHYFYYSEHKADTFATFILLKLGFTPAQIYASISSTLNETISDYRIKRNRLILINK